LTIEKYLYLYYHLYGLDYVSLRFSNAYGLRQDPNGTQGAIAVFLGNIMHNMPIQIWGDGGVIRDYIYVKDIVDACLKAVESRQNKYQVFNIGSGTGTSLNELIEIISKIIGKKIKVEYTKGRNIDTPVNILDTNRAREVFSWSPKVSIEEGIKRVLLDDFPQCQ
jgi:UDP-glucose 4-epimerase